MAERSSLIEESLTGSAMGLFAGDALGAPLEGASHQAIQQRFGWVGEMIVGHREPGSYTDDTQLMIGILEALAEDDTLPDGRLARRFAENFERGRGYGSSTGGTLLLVKCGEMPPEALSRDSFGNGGAMGIAPLGVYFSEHLALVGERAAAACRTTHHHPEALAGALAVALCAALVTQCRLAGESLSRKAVLERLMGAESLRASPIAEPLSRLAGMPLQATPPDRAAFLARTFGCNLRAVESVPVAIAAALSASSLREAVEVAVNAGGDTDTQGAMAGGIAGAYFGGEALPGSWLEVLENGRKGRDYVLAMVRKLAARS